MRRQGAQDAVLITGMGVLSPIGMSIGEVTDAIRTMRSGIRLVQAPPLSKAYPAGQIARDFRGDFPMLELPYLDRCQQLAVLAARQAMVQAGIDDFAACGGRAGLYYGNVNGGTATDQECHRQFLCDGKQQSRPFSAMAIMQNGAAAQISIRHRIHGPVHTHGSACAASAAAIGEAARAIRDGYLDIAVAGGAEAPLAAGMFFVFDGTRALAAPDPEDVGRSCRPFCASRSGLVLAEGAAFLVLESEQHAQRRGARGLASVAGYGIASDAHHIGAPSAQGQERAIRMALADAGREPGQIDYCNAHGTATQGGDPTEAAAIRAVFGSGDSAVPVSSTKSLHGHLLGASGALECIVSVIALREQMLPATAFMRQPDPACALNHVANSPVFGCELRSAISLSCGFGGTNVALVISRRRETTGAG